MTTTSVPESRVQLWVQNFFEHDRETMQAIGENLQYFLDHVDAFENSNLHHTDLPNLEEPNQWLMKVGVLFGVRHPMATGEVHIILHDGEFVGLYGDVDNAIDRVHDFARDGVPCEIRHVTPETSPSLNFIDPLATSTEEKSRQTAENLKHIHEHAADWDGDNASPDDMPHFSEDAKWLLAYSTLFGILWELSHPGLYCVFGFNQEYVAVYGEKSLAEAHAGELGESHMAQRVTVVDGDVPPEHVLGTIFEDERA